MRLDSDMAAYIVVQLVVTDPAAMQRYRDAVPPIVERFGGRYVIRGGRRERLEGTGDAPGVAVVSFENRERALAWYRSPDYAPWLAMRLAASRSEAVLVDLG